MEEKKWLKFAAIFKDAFNLEYSPVAITVLKEPLFTDTEKTRACSALLQAAKGESLQLNKDNNVCFGGSRHLGFQKYHGDKIKSLVKKFVVEKEKLFSSGEAYDKLMSQIDEPPDNSANFFLFAPLEKTNIEPHLVVFIVNPEIASRLSSLIIFSEREIPDMKIGGPTCRMSITQPLVSGKINFSLFDYTSRKICRVDKDKLVVSIPYAKVPALIENIDKCSAGRAKIEPLE